MEIPNKETINSKSGLKTNTLIVAMKLANYFTLLDEFKEKYNLYNLDNIHEVCNSMTDKHGRICRNVKHLERGDPRSQWKTEICESVGGWLCYMNMVLNKYGIEVDDLMKGLQSEMIKAVEQHSNTGEKEDDSGGK